MPFSRISTWIRFMVVVVLLLLLLTNVAATSKPRQGRRALPEKVLVAYAGACDQKVTQAVQDGVNVVIWAFLHMPSSSSLSLSLSSMNDDDENFLNYLDFECIQNLKEDLDAQGYNDTVHLVSIGGWNGPHLDPYFWNNTDLDVEASAQKWYTAWKALVGDVFHGLDVDWEGNDDMENSLNFVAAKELRVMGAIMDLAKADDYIITVVPPQSYLDIHSSSFDRYLNHTDDQRTWHEDFSYFGHNLYAYWLAEHGDSIDLVMIQFYESYSRASMEIHTNYVTPENYLQDYVWDLHNGGTFDFLVDFSKDPSIGFGKQKVSLPISKLVWGFGNGWAMGGKDPEKNLYFPPECVQAAYQGLWDWMIEPRGLMFWNIGNEGTSGVEYAKGLNEILHTRTASKSRQEVHEEEHILLLS